MNEYDILDDAPAPDATEFPNVAVFVEEFLAPTYRRDVTGSRAWRCPRWWSHAEAISRLEALWRAWEFARLDPHTGMSNWWPACDQTMNALMSPGGTFRKCSGGTHTQMPALAIERPPAALFGEQGDE